MKFSPDSNHKDPVCVCAVMTHLLKSSLLKNKYHQIRCDRQRQTLLHWDFAVSLCETTNGVIIQAFNNVLLITENLFTGSH